MWLLLVFSFLVGWGSTTGANEILDLSNFGNRLSLTFQTAGDYWLYLWHSDSRNFRCSYSPQQLKNSPDVSLVAGISDEDVAKGSVSQADGQCPLNDGVCTLHFSNRSKGSYCAQKLSMSIALYSATVKITGGSKDPATYLEEEESNLLSIIVAVVIVGVAVIVLAFFLIRAARGSHQPSYGPSLTTTFQSVPSADTDVKVVVLYYSDVEERKVRALVELLREAIKCRVMVDYERREEMAVGGVHQWVTRQMEACDKVVFISSPLAHSHIRAIINHQPQAHNSSQHVCNKVFQFGWRYVTASSQLCHNYSKVYNLTFESGPNILTPIIVPQRHFLLCTHLLDLLKQLSSDASIAANLISTSEHYQQLSS